MNHKRGMPQFVTHDVFNPIIYLEAVKVVIATIIVSPFLLLECSAAKLATRSLSGVATMKGCGHYHLKMFIGVSRTLLKVQLHPTVM